MKQIVIVEDEGIVVKYLTKLLEHHNYKITATFSSGEALLNTILDLEIDLILMDISLEGEMDGIETAINIYQYYQIPVIFITGFADESILTRAKEAGSYGCLIKPIKTIDLLTTIEMTLSKKSLETALKKSEAKYRNLVESISEIVYSTNDQGVFTYLNPAAERIMGYTIDEMLGMSFIDYIHPDDHIKAREALDSSRGKNTIFYRMITKNKEIRWLEVIFHKRYHNQFFVGFNGIARDITDQKTAEKERFHLDQAVQTISEGIIITNTFGDIQYFNEAIENIYGCSAIDLIGKKINIINATLLTQIINNEVIKSRYSHSRKEQLIRTDITGYPIQNELTQISGYILVIRDVTWEEEHERKIQQSRKMAAIGQIASGIAHEINTPMQFILDNTTFISNSIIGLLNAFEQIEEIFHKNCSGIPNNNHYNQAKSQIKTIFEQFQIDFLKEELPMASSDIHQGIERVRKIVLAMKDFAHPGRNTMSFCNINKLIESTGIITKNAWKYHAKLILDLELDLPFIYCTPDEISQVFLNMVVNSTDAIEETGKQGEIKITTHSQGDSIIITISDTGNGIESNQKEKIFDPFFTTKEVGKGSGQGLAISYNIIVEKHHGRIDIDSQKGEGTTFTIYLPIKPKNMEQELL